MEGERIIQNKFVSLSTLITTVPITIFLIIIFFHGNLITKLILLPFIVCSIATVLRSSFILLEKVKLARYCNTIYVISFLSYIIGFLIAFCYFVIKSHEYQLIAIALIGWGIIILIIRHLFFKKKKSSKQPMSKEQSSKRQHLRIKLKKLTRPAVFIVVLIIGIMLLGFGVYNYLQLTEKTKGYKEVIGHFTDAKIYHQDEDGTTYYLVYYYIVNGQKYEISTSFGSGVIPKQDSTRVIKYNPNYPEEAMLVGGESFVLLWLVGGMFTVISILFLIETFNKKNKKEKVHRFNFFTFGMGIFFCSLCFGILYMMTGTFSLIKIFNIYRLNFLIPGLILTVLILVGLYFIVFSIYQAIFYKKNN